jgi:hypothetical protein
LAAVPKTAFQLIKQGNLRVEIHFADALTATINVIMYAEFDNVIEIDRNRQILFDYSVQWCPHAVEPSS